MNLSTNTHLISELKQVFTYYQPYWDEWVKASQMNFSADELYAIDVYQKNNFRIYQNELVMFYNSSANLKKIHQKLNDCLPEYKRYVIKKLVLAFSKIAGEQDIELKCETRFSSLKMPLDAAAMFSAFGAKTANELFSAQNIMYLQKNKVFKEVLTALKCIERHTGKLNPTELNILWL